MCHATVNATGCQAFPTAWGGGQRQARVGAIPHAMAAIWNTLLHITRDIPGPLAAARETLGENQMAAITAAQTCVL